MIYMTVGTTGCGKTTWCKKQPMHYISDDTLRTMLYKQYLYIPRDEDAIKAGAITLARGIDLLGEDVVIDSAAWFLTVDKRANAAFHINGYKSQDQATWVVFPKITEEQYVNRIKSYIICELSKYTPVSQHMIQYGTYRGLSVDQWVEIFRRHESELDLTFGDYENVMYL